jgi:hypothetical protein
MKKIFKVALLLGIIALLPPMFAVSTYAQSYKMMAPAAGQQMFYGETTLGDGSKTVNVLPSGTVTAATATLSSGFTPGTTTPRLAVTKSGGSIVIQAFDDTGTNTTSSAKVFYTGGGSQ